MSEEEIARLRREIDALDDALLETLNRRAALARRIGELKGQASAYRPERESEVLRRIAAVNPGPLPSERVSAVFREIVSACRAMEAVLRVAYLGPEGTFSEQAVERHFGRAVQALPEASIDEVFRGVEAGRADFAIVPVENSTEGMVGRTLDLLLASPLRICGEVELRIRQNLFARTESLAEIARVYSHAQSLAQCRDWLARHLPRAERIPVASNAEAARRAATEPGAAAIAGAAAGERHGLRRVAAGIEDDANNTTRFLVLGRLAPAPTGRDRTSLAVSAENRPGALHALLAPFAEHGISMTRIESRPAHLRSALWEYVFFIDIEGHERDAVVASALAALRTRAPFLRVLGSYPIATD